MNIIIKMIELCVLLIFILAFTAAGIWAWDYITVEPVQDHNTVVNTSSERIEFNFILSPPKNAKVDSTVLFLNCVVQDKLSGKQLQEIKNRVTKAVENIDFNEWIVSSPNVKYSPHIKSGGIHLPDGRLVDCNSSVSTGNISDWQGVLISKALIDALNIPIEEWNSWK